MNYGNVFLDIVFFDEELSTSLAWILPTGLRMLMFGLNRVIVLKRIDLTATVGLSEMCGGANS